MGVLGAIIPWNYPFHNMFGQIISAIFAGNALVLKVSEHSTWSSEYYIQIVQVLFGMVRLFPLPLYHPNSADAVVTSAILTRSVGSGLCLRRAPYSRSFACACITFLALALF